MKKPVWIIPLLILTFVLPIQAASWQPVTTITGATDKTTDYFNIPSTEWRITWHYTPETDYPQYAVFGYFIYPKGETVSYIDNAYRIGAAETTGTTYIHKGPGDYYLKIIVANLEGYTFTIEYDKDSVPRPGGTSLFIIIIGAAAFLILVIVAIGIIFYVAKRKKPPEPPTPISFSHLSQDI